MSGENIQEIAQGALLAEEYRRSYDFLSAVQNKYAQELKVLKGMKIFSAVCGIGALVAIIAIVIVGIERTSHDQQASASWQEVVSSWHELVAEFRNIAPTLTAQDYIALLGVVVMGALSIVLLFIQIYFIPAGVIGLWRVTKNAGWFVWVGSLIFFIIVIWVVLCIVLIGGVFFYLSQHMCVKNLEKQLAAAQERYAVARAAMC